MTNQARMTLILLSLVMPLVQGCGPSGMQGTGPGPGPKDPMPNLPEAHGPMKFESVVKEPLEVQTPVQDPGSQTTSSSSAGSDAKAEMPVFEVPVAPSRLLCQDAYDPGKAPSDGLICPTCQKGEFTQPAPKRAKLDILFVADSSPSLESQREAIGKGINRFISALPNGTDYAIAVMAAHADKTYDESKKTTGGAGKLVVIDNEPAVLKKSDYSDWNKITQLLTRKLRNIKSEGATDGGEVGLYSLDKGISEPLLSRNRKLGFFRPDAALAIIFISDENDICSYGVDYPPGVTPKPNVNMYKDTGLTVEEKANQFYCRDENGNPTVTSRMVFEKLRNLKKKVDGQPDEANVLLISGILHTDETLIPKVPPADEKYPEYFGEKEVGYGYMNMIEMNGGLAVDISKGDFNENLRMIGEAAALKLEVKSEFQLRNGSSIDENTLCVLVDGKEVRQVADFGTRVDGLSYVFKPDLREVHLRGVGATNSRGAPSKVEVFYCEPPSVINYNPEIHSAKDIPTPEQHYRNLPVPSACQSVKARINSGALGGD